MRARAWPVVIAVALLCGHLVASREASAAACTKVLVDASHDGGAWWFPQAGPFNAAQAHQGKPLADFLRARGLNVVELARGTTVTPALLSGADLVIRASEFGTYAQSEINAYHDFVAGGGRLLLLSDYLRPGQTDTLAQSFGIQFLGTSQGQNVINTFVPHPITQNVVSVPYVVGSGIVTPPVGATMLGFLSQTTFLDLNDNGVKDPGEPAGAGALGIMPFGSGSIVFLGDTNALENLPQPLTSNILDFFCPAQSTTVALDGIWLFTEAGPGVVARSSYASIQQNGNTVAVILLDRDGEWTYMVGTRSGSTIQGTIQIPGDGTAGTISLTVTSPTTLAGQRSLGGLTIPLTGSKVF